MTSIFIVLAGHGDITATFHVAGDSEEHAAQIIQKHLESDSWQEIEREELGWLHDVDIPATTDDVRYRIFHVSEAERDDNGEFIDVDAGILNRPGEFELIEP